MENGGHFVMASWILVLIVIFNLTNADSYCQLDPLEQTSVKFKSKCNLLWETTFNDMKYKNSSHIYQEPKS